MEVGIEGDYIVIIIMYIYYALINVLSAHMIPKYDILTHVEHSPTKTIYIRYTKNNNNKNALNTHTHTHTHARTHARTHTHTRARAGESDIPIATLSPPE